MLQTNGWWRLTVARTFSGRESSFLSVVDGAFVLGAGHVHCLPDQGVCRGWVYAVFERMYINVTTATKRYTNQSRLSAASHWL